LARELRVMRPCSANLAVGIAENHNMISSVIAKLSPGESDLKKTLDEIAAHPDLEVGALIDNRLLPVTIDSTGKQAMENTTRWLQARDGVEFIDVVFVHFGDEQPQTSRTNDNGFQHEN
jgi:hypothetical protein